jgi:alkylation response protein AidB-like acyl-CoA dehydrogenase
MGLDAVTSCIILEELAAGDPGYALTWHVNNIAITFLYNIGNEAQALEWIKPIIGPDGGVSAITTTEPDGGTTSSQITEPTLFTYKTTARLDGEYWVVNGSKVFCSNAGLPFNRWVMTFCRADMSKVGAASMGVIVVPMGTSGFEVVGEEDKMGHRLSSTVSLSYSDVRVPRRNSLSGGVRTITYDHDSAVGAIAIGIARSAYEAAVDYARTRLVMERPIIQYQLIQNKIADMFTGLEAARALVFRTASYSDSHPVMDVKLARAVKIFATETAMKIVYDALQIFGGAGYTKATAVEKAYRDIRVSTIYEGTNEALRISLAKLVEAGL